MKICSKCPKSAVFEVMITLWGQNKWKLQKKFKNLLYIVNILHQGFMGVVSILKGLKSWKTTEDHDFPIFPFIEWAFLARRKHVNCPLPQISWVKSGIFHHFLTLLNWQKQKRSRAPKFSAIKIYVRFIFRSCVDVTVSDLLTPRRKGSSYKNRFLPITIHFGINS